MVWFQCEDCGENLKKPKLLNHFNRCSAYKLSCIDCGVVFDRETVQAHTSCVTEVEKYGPKGAGAPTTSKSKNGKEQVGHEIDISRGLSTFPPWFCSLCNVKATSKETLEIHAQGKKHRSKAKAAAKGNATQDEATDIVVDLTIGASNDELKLVAKEQGQSFPGQFWEKKRKKEQVDDTGEKKPKRDRDTQDGEGVSEETGDSQEKKRKHLEEQPENPTGQDQNVTVKKSRKRDKVMTQEKGHDKLDTNEVVESSGQSGKAENQEQLRKKEKKGLHREVSSPSENLTNVTKGQSFTNGNGVPLHNLTLKVKAGDPIVNKKTDSGKKSKKGKVLAEDLTDCVALATSEELDEDGSKSSKKERCRKAEKKETIAHEVSFREWLGPEDDGQEDTPTHPASHDMTLGKERVQQLEGVEKTREALHKQWENSATIATQDEISKMVKWKKLIKEALRKSVNGRMKKKDLKKFLLPLAVLAAESSAISVDKKSLKAELMRQVSSSPKFVVDGNHVMLAPKVN